MVRRQPKLKTVLILSAGILILISVALLMLYLSQKPVEELTVSAVAELENGTARIELMKMDDGYYFFLPSHVDLNDCTLSINEGYTVQIGGKVYADGDLLENVEGETLSFMLGDTEVLSSEFFIMQADNTDAIYINTQSGNMNYVHENKENKEAADMLYISAESEIIYNGELEYIKGRGNQSFLESDKKPYNIKLKKATDLLGSGSSKKWALISNYFDQSGFRNELVFDFAKAANLEFTPDCRTVDLYLNGEYSGTYLLSERVEIGEGRVEIDNLEKAAEGINKLPLSESETVIEQNRKYYNIAVNPANITGGYILELEFTDRYSKESSWFRTNGGLAVVFSSPEYVSKAQMEYVSSLVQEFEDALYAENGINPKTGKSWEEYIDLTSWAQKYLIEEIFGNQDMEWSSQYLYIKKDEYKLYAGPVWDYDYSIGNGDSCVKNPETLISTWRGSSFSEYSHWLPQLIKKNSFMAEVKKIYNQTMRPLCEEYLGKIEQYREKYKNSAAMNEVRWYNGENVTEQNVIKLKEYFKEHIDFLDRFWIDGEDYCFISFVTEVPWKQAILYAVKRGERLRELPILTEVKDDEFLGWFIEETGQSYTKDMIITEDIKIIGIWKSQGE